MATSGKILLSIVLVELFLVRELRGQAVLDSTTELYDNIFRIYNKNIRPINEVDEPVEILVSFRLAYILDFDDLTGLLVISSALSLKWIDSRLKWNPPRYNNVSFILASYQDIWKPDFVSLNAPDHEKLPALNAKIARINSMGNVLVQSLDKLEVICSVNVHNYPYDSQSCSFDIYPWGYRGTEVKFTYDYDSNYGDRYIPDTVESSAWTLSEPQINITTTNRTSGLFINLRFTRKFTYAIANLIVPVFILSLLNTWVFILPPESGERISFSITVFLSFAVYMSIVADYMPRGSHPLPILTYQMILNMIYSVSILFCTILSLRLFNNMDKKPVPVYLQKFIRFHRFKKRCCDSPNGIRNDKVIDDRRPAYDKQTPNMDGDVINTTNPYINNPRIASAMGDLSHKQHLPCGGDIHEANGTTRETHGPTDNNKNDDVTWLNIGRTFDMYMLVLHITWWIILVLLQWMVSIDSLNIDID